MKFLTSHFHRVLVVARPVKPLFEFQRVLLRPACPEKGAQWHSSRTLAFSSSVITMSRRSTITTKTTSIERNWDWILKNLKVVTEHSRKMYGWYERTTEHPNTRSDVLATEPPGSSVSEVGILLCQQSVLHFCSGSWKKEKGCVHFTVVGVQKIYQGDTVSYIMTEMLVRCWKRAKQRERIAKPADKCSFFLTGRKIKNNLWNQGSYSRCKLQRALYSALLPRPYKKRILSGMDFIDYIDFQNYLYWLPKF